MPRYCVAGLQIESGLALPGLAPASPGALPDVAVRVGETPERLAGAIESGASWERAEGALLVSLPGLARILIREAGEIVVDPDPQVPVEELAAIIAGSMLGVFLHLRGRVVLQASAVAVGGGAVLFCGETGAGKSTLAAALGQRGYPMLCDDLCAIDMAAAGGARAHADAVTLQLWTQAISRLGVEAGPPVRAALQKHHVTPAAGSVAAAPVRAVYVLQEARGPDTPGIARPNVADLALLVRFSAFRPNLVRALDQRTAYFAAATRLATTTGGVFTFTRELGFERMDGALDALEAHWTGIGLAPEEAA